MSDDNTSIDLDYVILAAAFTGLLAAGVTAVTMLARPALAEWGKTLPLPEIGLTGGKDD